MAVFSTYMNKRDNQKYWQVSAYLGMDRLTGKEVKVRKKGFLRKNAAKAYLNEQATIFETNGTLRRTKYTFEEVYQMWLKTYKFTVKESSYVKLLGKFRVHILPIFGDKLIQRITTAEIQDFTNELSKELFSFKEYTYNISRILDFAVKREFISKNPAVNIIMPRGQQKQTHRKNKFYTKKQQQALLKDAQKNEPLLIYAFFQLMATTGCREGELLGLFWEDIDFDRSIIRIRRTLTRGEQRRLYLGEPKTKNSWRVVELTSKTATILKSWQKQQVDFFDSGITVKKSEQLIFSNSKNEFTELTHPRLWLMRINKRAGLPELSPHALRHTFASILVNNGVDPHTISKMLGHASVSTTLDIYSDIFQETQMEASRIVEENLG